MKKDKTARNCPVCQNNIGAELIYTQEFVLRENHPLPAEYDVVACGICGTTYADSIASQATYDTYYRELSRYELNYTCEDSLLYVERAAWINGLISDKASSLIDIGCGNGQLLLHLKRLGLSDLTGLDPSAKCVDDLHGQGINGIVSSIFTLATGRKYDAAILSGVLEHIYDVPALMEAMRQLLKPTGLLFVCVPDASRYRDFDLVPFDYFNIEHINHFDETSLFNLGLQHGFSMRNLQKSTITIAATTQPIIYFLYENTRRQPCTWQSYSASRLGDYVEQTRRDVTVVSVINRLAETREAIVLWGAGNYTNRLLATSNLDQCDIALVVDSDRHKQGTVIRGWTVYDPRVISELGKTATILVCAAVFSDEIVEEVRRMGLTNTVIALGKTRGSAV